jgi:hypothetical protein
MALVRWVTEMGMGVDVHGYDYTKAARRAVSDALRHSSLNFFRATDQTLDDMHVEVIVAVARQRCPTEPSRCKQWLAGSTCRQSRERPMVLSSLTQRSSSVSRNSYAWGHPQPHTYLGEVAFEHADCRCPAAI